MTEAIAKVEKTGLLHYDAWMKELALAHRVDEVTKIRARARVVEVYMKQARNFEGERLAAEIRIRGERKAGQVLIEMAKNGERETGGGDKKSPSHDGRVIPTLKLLGVSPKEAEVWQALAKVPEKQFEAALADPVMKPTTAAIIARSDKKLELPKADSEALWVWGTLLDFEGSMLSHDPKEVAAKVDYTMRDDITRLAPLVCAWLKKHVEELQ